MFKWIIIFLILSYNFAFAQRDTTNFKVTIRDDSLIKVLRRYIRIGETKGLHKDESILIMTASDRDDPDEPEWYIGAINAVSSQQRTRTIPAHISELDGYPIIIYFRQRPDQFFNYSKAYLDYLDSNIFVRLRNKSIQRQLSSGSIKVTFVKGKSPSVLGLL